jgi:hypothetical protein
MTELEKELMAIMVKLIVRYPDGLERICVALEDVIAAGQEMALEQERTEWEH